jgi:tetratricopeptide (TPR) repeat protein
MGHHFISYSVIDGRDVAIRLKEALEAGRPPLPVWLDVEGLVAGRQWTDQLDEAIRECDTLLFVITPDSVREGSFCATEVSRALSYKKRVLPLRFDPDARVPIRLETTHWVDFATDGFEKGLQRLRRDVQRHGSPEGVLWALRDRLAVAERDLDRAVDPVERTRIQQDVLRLQEQVSRQEQVVRDPQGAEERTSERVQLGMEHDRRPRTPTSTRRRTVVVNTPPVAVRASFQDRDAQIRLLSSYLREDGWRLLTVIGRAGIGKSAMVCRLLHALSEGQPPDGIELDLDGIVYLNTLGAHRVSLPDLLAGLSRLLPEDDARALAPLLDSEHRPEERMLAVLERFPAGRHVVLLDNFERLLDPETHEICDRELDQGLRTLLKAPEHGVKVILTTQIAPRRLVLSEPGRQAPVPLEEGLPSPYAERFLRELDADGSAGLRDASDELLGQARQRTYGYPKALEALRALLAVDRHTSLREVLADDRLLSDTVVEVLVGETFNRLDQSTQQVMEALAVYGSPMTPAAVDYLLQPYLVGVDSRPVLDRLVDMQLVLKEAGRYRLSPVERGYAYSRIPPGQAADVESGDPAPFTRSGLLGRAIAYVQQTTVPVEKWRGIEDVAPQLTEIDLLCTSGQFDAAARLLRRIDYGFLLPWGHAGLVADLHERLRTKLGDPELQQESTGMLGTARFRLGAYDQAILRFTEALALARAQGDQRDQGTWLGNLAGCYLTLGDTARAADCYEEALAAARAPGYPMLEASALQGLAACDQRRGALPEALGRYEESLKIARELGYWQTGVAEILVGLGQLQGELGQSERALSCFEQACGVADELGDERVKGLALAAGAEVLLDQGRLQEAVAKANEAVDLGGRVADLDLRGYGSYVTALAHLGAGRLPEAQAAIEAALQRTAGEAWRAQAVRGVIALRQQDPAAARGSFAAAISRADADLLRGSQRLAAVDVKGLSLAGLALVEDDEFYLEASDRAYRAARAVTDAPGVVARVRRLLEELRLADPVGRLAKLNPAERVLA